MVAKGDYVCSVGRGEPGDLATVQVASQCPIFERPGDRPEKLHASRMKAIELSPDRGRLLGWNPSADQFPLGQLAGGGGQTVEPCFAKSIQVPVSEGRGVDREENRQQWDSIDRHAACEAADAYIGVTACQFGEHIGGSPNAVAGRIGHRLNADWSDP